MNRFLTVVRFTLLNKLKAKSFIISTLIFAIIISIGLNVPYIISKFNSGDKVKEIGYIQSSADDLGTATGDRLREFFTEVGDTTIVFKGYQTTGDKAKDETMLKDAMKNEDLYGYLDFGPVTVTGFPEMTFKSEKLLEYSISGKIENALQLIRQDRILSQSGLTAEQVTQLSAPITIASIQISASGTGSVGSVGEGKTAAEQGVNMGIIYFIIIFLFMAVMISGQMIASEVTAEKSSRVMEVLITSVSPLISMFGKITGMFLLILSQLVIYLGVGIINLTMPHNQKMLSSFNIDLSGVDVSLLVFSAVYFLAGFFLFATLYAAVGSIVSRTEDLGQAIMPMTFVSLAGFYIAIFSISTPDSLLVKISSFIPLFSPFVMVLRIGLTDIPLWEILTSVGILLVAIYVSVYISAKIYRTGVLMYGKRPGWKEIRKAMKAYKI